MSWGDDVRDDGPADACGDHRQHVDRLRALAAELGTDELRVLVLMAERLAKGRKRYGVLNLANDRRHFRSEAVEELLDAVAYLAMGLLQPQHRDRLDGADVLRDRGG